MSVYSRIGSPQRWSGMHTVDCSISTYTTWQLMSLYANKKPFHARFDKRSTDFRIQSVELNTPFKFDYFWQGTKSVDDFRIQYVGIFNKGVFNEWGITVFSNVLGLSLSIPFQLASTIHCRRGALRRWKSREVGAVVFSVALYLPASLFRLRNLGFVMRWFTANKSPSSDCITPRYLQCNVFDKSSSPRHTFYICSCANFLFATFTNLSSMDSARDAALNYGSVTITELFAYLRKTIVSIVRIIRRKSSTILYRSSLRSGSFLQDS